MYKVIGSDSEDPDPVYLDDFEYEGGAKEVIDIGGTSVSIDTNIQMFCDYMEIRLSTGTIIDLHHLLVGWDVLNHVNTDTSDIMADIKRIYTIYALAAAHNDPFLEDKYLRRLRSLPTNIGSNVDAATWIGDIGSVSADWQKRNKSTQQTLKDYYNSRASDMDIVSDIIPHSIYGYQLQIQEKRRMMEYILYGQLNRLQVFGTREFIYKFRKYLDLRSSSKPLSAWACEDMDKFSICWFIRDEYSEYLDMDDAMALKFKDDITKINKNVWKEFMLQMDKMEKL